MLTTTQCHDRRHVLPFVLSHRGKDYFLVRQVELGNLAGAGFTHLPVVPFLPYFLPDPVEGVHETAAKAALAVAGSDPITVDAATPVSVFEELGGAATVSVQREPGVPVWAYKLTRQKVLGAFNHHRPEVVDVAQRLTAGHPQADRLGRWYAADENTSFELLDRMAGERGIGALLATWVTDFQELAGLPGRLAEFAGCCALYLVGTGETWVLAKAGYGVPGEMPVRSYPDIASAVRDIAGSAVVGYEADTMGASAFLDLVDRGVDLADGGGVMRDWREEKAHCDIPYFVVCAMASRYAIDSAIDFARRAIRGGVQISEKDVDRIYVARVREFAREWALPIQLELYFTNNHAGARSIYPSRPVDYKLDSGIVSLKADAGLFAYDDGLFHACSDIARTLTTTGPASEVFDAMEKVMLEQTIPGILPGMTGAEIHEMGTNQMGGSEPVFRMHGFMPDGFHWRTGYKRDIGHVLERQESNTFGFKPGVTRPVHAGMVGCVEFHCAYDGHGMTCEDTFVIDEGGAIVISRGAEEFGSSGIVTNRRRSGCWVL
jgi:Xaa-Pro aminopeptidase